MLEGNSMISPVTRQNNNYNPSFGMKFGPKMQDVFDSEAAVGKLHKSIRDKYYMLKNDEATDSLVVDISNNPNFPYSPNANITPRFFLNVSSPKVPEPNDSTTILGEGDEKIGLSFKNIIALISNEFFPKTIMTKLLKQQDNFSTVEKQAQDAAFPISLNGRLKQAEQEMKMPSNVIVNPEVSYVGVGENFKNIFAYRQQNELLKSQDIKAYNSVLNNPRYAGLSFDIKRSSKASIGNKPIKFSLMYKDNYSDKKASCYQDLEGKCLFEFSDILKILDSEEFLTNLGR